MPIFIGPRGGLSGGSGGRQTVLLSGSPFTTLAALETFSQANPTELFNNSSQVALAVVTSDPTPSNNGTYEYAGPNLQYQANQWVMFSGLDAADIKNLYESNPNTNAFTNADNTAVTSIQGLTENRIPIATASGLQDSAIRDTPNAIMVDKELQIPSGSLLLDDLLTLSEDTGFIGLTNNATGDRFSVIDSRHDRTNGSFRPQNFFLTGGQTQTIIQSDDSVQITANDFTFNYTTQLTGQTNIIEFRTYAALTNVRVRITDTISGVPFKHLPNRASWDSGTNGANFPTIGDNVFDLDNSTVRLAPNRQLTFEIRADQAGFLGADQTTPYFAIQFQAAEFRPLAWLQDIEHPVTLRRDMPTEEDAQRIVDSSLNQNSALWVVANDQLTTSNRSDAIMNALRSGLLDADGNEIPTTSVPANQIRLRGGSIVRIFAANNYRVVSVPTSMTDVTDRVRSDEEIRDVVGAALVAGNNVTIVDDDAANTITISASVSGGTSPTTPQPSFERFEFQSQPTSVPAGTTLSGPLTFNLRVNRPDLLTGTLTLRQGNSIISSTIQPTATSFTATITSVTLAAGESVSFTIEGTVTSGGTITSHITVRSPQTHEIAYWGIRSSNDFATTPLTNLNSVDVTTNSEFDVTGAFDNDNFIGILVPPTHDVREITTFNLPVKDQFTRTANARTIGSQDYILYTLENNGGIDGTAAYTVEI